MTTFIDQVLDQIANLGHRFLNVSGSGFHYSWLIIFVVGTLAFYALEDGSWRDKWLRVQSFLSSARFRIELKKDVYFLVLRFLYKPLFFVYLAINSREIENFLFKTAEEWGFGLSQPILHMEPVIGSVVIGCLIFMTRDFIHYWTHALQHRIPFLWYFHMSHHFASALTPLTKYRLHPIDYLYTNIFPLILEVPAAIFIYKAFAVHGQKFDFTVIMVLSYGIHYSLLHFRHSHIPLGYGFLSHFLLSPVMHQVHHSRERKHFNKNIGVNLSFWDGMFGTLYIPEKGQRFQFGIKGYERLIQRRSLLFEIYFPFLLIYRDCRKWFRKLFKSTKKKSVSVAPEGSKSPSQFRASGFTLTEVLLAVLVFSIVAIAGSSIMIVFVKYYKNQADVDQVEAEMDLSVGHMKMITSRAVNVRFYGGGTLNGTMGAPTGEGYVRSFNYTTDASMTTNSETLMFFARETRTSRLDPEGGTPLSSEFRPTGVFFVRKNESAVPGIRRSGRIVIDYGEDNSDGWVIPDGDNDVEFNYVSDVILDQQQFAQNDVLLSIRMRVAMIYPLISAEPGLDCLGPTGDINAGLICNPPNTRAFRIIRKSFTLNFPNNKRDIPFSGGEFGTGLYMFPPAQRN